MPLNTVWSSSIYSTIRLIFLFLRLSFSYFINYGGTKYIAWGYSKNWVSVIARSGLAAKSLQSCPTLCDPIDSSQSGSPVPGILQARTLGWVAISFSNAWKWKVKVKSFSRVQLLATPWTAAYQAPPSMGFSRQEYWSGVPLPSPNNATRNLNSFHLSVLPGIICGLLLSSLASY